MSSPSFDQAIGSLITDPATDVIDLQHFIIPIPETKVLKQVEGQMADTDKKMEVLKLKWVTWYRIISRVAYLGFNFLRESAYKQKILTGISIANAEVMVVRLGLRAGASFLAGDIGKGIALLVYMGLMQTTIISQRQLEKQQVSIIEHISQIDMWSDSF